MVPLGCASKAGILKWWHTTFAHTFVCTQPQNAKILLENIYADENVFFRIPSNLLLFNKNFVKLNACVSNLLYGHLFKRIIISCFESIVFRKWSKQLRRLIEGSNESLGTYMFEGFEFWNFWGPTSKYLEGWGQCKVKKTFIEEVSWKNIIFHFLVF